LSRLDEEDDEDGWDSDDTLTAPTIVDSDFHCDTDFENETEEDETAEEEVNDKNE
jgi:hypothetical protein